MTGTKPRDEPVRGMEERLGAGSEGNGEVEGFQLDMRDRRLPG